MAWPNNKSFLGNSMLVTAFVKFIRPVRLYHTTICSIRVHFCYRTCIINTLLEILLLLFHANYERLRNLEIHDRYKCFTDGIFLLNTKCLQFWCGRMMFVWPTKNIRFQMIFVVLNMKPYSPVEVQCHFGGTCCFHLQGCRVGQKVSSKKQSANKPISYLLFVQEWNFV